MEPPLAVQPADCLAAANVLHPAVIRFELQSDQRKNVVRVAGLLGPETKDDALVVVAELDVLAAADAACACIARHGVQTLNERRRQSLPDRSQHVRNQTERLHDEQMVVQRLFLVHAI